jgi:hypothetical protein
MTQNEIENAYNDLPIRVTTLANFPTSYSQLSPEQKLLVDELLDAGFQKFEDFEALLDETRDELQNAADYAIDELEASYRNLFKK